MLPILSYWLAVGGISYELIHLHDAPSSALEESPKTGAVAPQGAQPWWQQALAGAPLARSPEPTEPPLERAAQPVSAPTPAPAPAATPTDDEPRHSSDVAVLEQPPGEPFATSSARASQRRTVDDSSEPARHAHNARARSTIASGAEPTGPELPQSTASFSNRDSDKADSPALSPALSPARAELRAGKSLPSCEAAAAAASEEIDLAHRAVTPDLPRESIAAVLDNGAWLGGCSIPDSTSLDICVAISSGSVIGATVVAHPGNAALSACLERRAATLFFPYSAHLDLARTRFAAH